MDSKQFRECGQAVIDILADYYDNIRDRNVLPSVEPGYLIKNAPENAPEQPEEWESVLKEFSETIMPGLTHWQSPQFHAYYPTGGSYPSIIGSLLCDGIAVMGFTWSCQILIILFLLQRAHFQGGPIVIMLGSDDDILGKLKELFKFYRHTCSDFGFSIASPACTELEVITMNWLGKLLGLPEEFLNCSAGPGGGIIQGSASEATLVGLLAAKDRMIRRILENDPDADEDLIKTKFVAYTSDQCNSSVEKAGVLGSMKMRLLKTDSNCKLRGDTLKKAFEEDKAQGLIPCYVIANLGTTGTCAYDPLYELGPVCKEENVWLHVDAAYAGAACVCPEYRQILKGVELADSFDMNAHKWLLVNFDCSAMWVKDSYDLINAFDVQRIYLDDVKSEVRVPDYRHWQMPLGRRFRSLKLWTVLKMYGAEGLRKHIRNQISLAQHFVKLVQADERFVIEPEPSMGLVCFRLKNGDKLTKQLLENLTATKEVFMVACTYRSRYVIRFVVCSRFTTKEDIEVSWNIITREANRLVCPSVIGKSQSISSIDFESVSICEKSK